MDFSLVLWVSPDFWRGKDVGNDKWDGCPEGEVGQPWRVQISDRDR
jgi:hypothetical protein